MRRVCYFKVVLVMLVHVTYVNFKQCPDWQLNLVGDWVRRTYSWKLNIAASLPDHCCTDNDVSDSIFRLNYCAVGRKFRHVSCLILIWYGDLTIIDITIKRLTMIKHNLLSCVHLMIVKFRQNCNFIQGDSTFHYESMSSVRQTTTLVALATMVNCILNYFMYGCMI